MMRYKFQTENITRHLYWKILRKESTWNPISDNAESRQKAIESGAHFFTWLSLSSPYRDDQPEPTRYGDLVLDFDCKSDPGKALKEVRNLCLIHLPEQYGLDPNCAQYYASGSKGFHVSIPASIFGAEDGDIYLPLIYKKIVADWASSLDLHTIDQSMYCMSRGRPLRIENIRRENGKYKIPLTLEEIRTLNMDQITELTGSPREVEPVDGADSDPVQELVEQFQKHKVDIHGEEADRQQQPEQDADFEKVKNQIVPCINYILEKNPKTAKTNFNILTVNVVKFMQSAGYDYQSAVLASGKFIRNYPHSQTYTTAKARQKEFRKQWLYHEGRGNQFRCSYILGMGFPGSAFECSKCPLKKLEEKPTGNPVEPLRPEQTRIRDILKEEPPPPEFILSCRGVPFLRKGIVSLLVAAGGTGKTFLMLCLANCFASGNPWGCFQPAEPLRTLFIGAEDDSKELDRRLWSIGNGNFPVNLHAVSMAGKIGALMKMSEDNPAKSDWFQWLNGTIENHMPLDILMLDPLSRLYGLKENSNEHATEFVRVLEELSIKFNINIMVSHHINKASAEQQKARQNIVRGASGFVDGVRHAVGLTDLSGDDATTYQIDDPDDYFKMTVLKANGSAKPSMPIFFRKNQENGLPEYVPVSNSRIESLSMAFLNAFSTFGQPARERDLKKGKPDELFQGLSGNLQKITISKDIPGILSFLEDNRYVYKTKISGKGKASFLYSVNLENPNS